MARRLPAEFQARAVRPAPSMPAALALGTALATLLAASSARAQAEQDRQQEWFVEVTSMC